METRPASPPVPTAIAIPLFIYPRQIAKRAKPRGGRHTTILEAEHPGRHVCAPVLPRTETLCEEAPCVREEAERRPHVEIGGLQRHGHRCGDARQVPTPFTRAAPNRKRVACLFGAGPGRLACAHTAWRLARAMTW